VFRRGKADAGVTTQTAVGLFFLVRLQLRHALSISGRVVERVLADLRASLHPLLEQDHPSIPEDAPVPAPAVEQSLAFLRERLPQAEHRYLEAFARQPYLGLFGATQGGVLDVALQALEKEERECREAYSGPPCWVIFNPPGDAAERWLAPSRIEQLADRL